MIKIEKHENYQGTNITIYSVSLDGAIVFKFLEEELLSLYEALKDLFAAKDM